MQDENHRLRGEWLSPNLAVAPPVSGWQLWYVCGSFHCPRACQYVTSHSCAIGCASASSAAKKAPRTRKANPLLLHCNPLTLRPELLLRRKRPKQTTRSKPLKPCWKKPLPCTNPSQSGRSQFVPAETRAVGVVAAAAAGAWDVVKVRQAERRQPPHRLGPLRHTRARFPAPRRHTPPRLRRKLRLGQLCPALRGESWSWPLACPAREKAPGSSGTTSRRFPATCCVRSCLTIPASSVFKT